MRITFLLTQSLESPSGLGRYWPLAKELQRLGHQVTVLALHHNYRAAEQHRFERAGVKIWYVGQMHVRKVGSQKVYFSLLRLLLVSAWATLALTWAAIAVPSDVYHICKPHPMNGIAGVIASRIKRKPLFLDCDDDEAESNVFTGKWQKRLVSWFERTIPSWVKGISVNSQFVLRQLFLGGFSEERIVYVPNGVERNWFLASQAIPPVELESLCEASTGVHRSVVLYAGSLSLKSHAVDILIEAFHYVLQTEPDAMLLVVGGGENLCELQDFVEVLGIESSVCFIGRVAPEQVAGYYRLARVSVDPVRDDPAARGRSPLKLFESWLAGVPCVTSDVGDRRLLLGNPPAGLLVSPGDSKSLARGLLRLLRDTSVCREISELGRARVEDFYWDLLVLRFAEVYSV